MNNTLRNLAIYFTAIAQCFVYRIFTRLMYDFFINVMIDEDGSATPMQTIIISIFYLSETIMMVGICISIRQQIFTVKQNSMNIKAGVSGLSTGLMKELEKKS